MRSVCAMHLPTHPDLFPSSWFRDGPLACVTSLRGGGMAASVTLKFESRYAIMENLKEIITIAGKWGVFQTDGKLCNLQRYGMPIKKFSIMNNVTPYRPFTRSLIKVALSSRKAVPRYSELSYDYHHKKRTSDVCVSHKRHESWTKRLSIVEKLGSVNGATHNSICWQDDGRLIYF